MITRNLLVKVTLLIFLSTRSLCQENCQPVDCIVSEWNNWSECSQTCGENGTRQRVKTVFRKSSCGGTCSESTEETELCNIKCCPKDCVFSTWSKWILCFCDSSGCKGGGERHNCQRSRTKIENEECGGFCDNIEFQQQCGNLCCYQNCVVSEWSFWGACQAQCEQKGNMKRTRRIQQEPRCHGKQCGPLEEYTQCTGSCCPVDCVLAEWSAWSKCNATCGESVETRVRYVRLPECKGEPCSETPDDTQTRPCTRYVNVDCMVSPWSTWTDCILDNGFCGEGVKTRSRTIERQPQCQGQSCGNLTETGICYGPCCIQDCIVSDWTEWSHCSTSCGQGISNRTKSIIQAPSCGGSACTDKLLDKRDCVVRDQIDCEFTTWSPWTACSADCGTGRRARTRTLITPAYCGGKCENEALEEEEECESYEAKQDCEVSKWSEWGECVRNCQKGDQTRNRTITVNPVCTGAPCPTEMVEHRECHSPCEQNCNLGLCSCDPGFRLSDDKVSCKQVMCPIPQFSYCPLNRKVLVDCRYPYFTCSGYKYNDTCSPYCSPGDWPLKGTPLLITCQNDATWTRPEIYCARPNKPPLGIEVDTTVIAENKPKDFCFAYISTVTEDEDYAVHTYTIIDDVTGRFYLRNDRLCLTRMTDYEQSPSKWNVKFRSTDIEGEFVEEVITFEVTDTNDPPTSVKIEPNTVPENSPPGTVVGCMSATDDDPGQTVKLTLVDSFQAIFATFIDQDKLCLKVVADSDPRCQTEGGTYCKLNKEVEESIYVTILAVDDGTPPMSAYYDLSIKLTNVNDKQTSIEIEPKLLPEEVDAGLPLVHLQTIDEDTNQQYTYTLLEDNDGLFQVDGDEIIATRVFDYEAETGEVFEVLVESIDDDPDNPMKVSQRIVMQIADINERPYDLQLSSVNGISQFDINKPRIKENIPSAVIGTISVKDTDAQDEITLEFVEGMDAGGRLSLINKRCSSLATVSVYCSASLTLTGSLDYETEGHVNVSISATDKLGETTYLNISIQILDSNDPPTKLLFDGQDKNELRVEEDRQDFIIGTLSVEDEDVDVSHTFELIDTSGLFVIENNALKTSTDSTLDYEVQSEHKIKVKCIDERDPPFSKEFEVLVQVTDVNEVPTATTLSNNKVRENSQENTFVGELYTTDPDNEIQNRQTFRYSLPDDAKGRFKLDGNKLLVKGSNRICGIKPCGLDFELEPNLFVSVLTMDDGNPRLQRQDTFVIEIENANDPPTDIKLTNTVINENEPPGTVIGTLVAFDQDGVETLLFALKDHEDIFGLQGGNKLVTKAALDYEYLRSYRIRASVMDDGSPPAESEEIILVQVLDVNERPQITNISEILPLRDDVQTGKPAAAFQISDPDSREIITVALTDRSSTFSLDEPICDTTPSTGATDCTVNLIANKRLDVESENSFKIELAIQDEDGLSSIYPTTIKVEDVNNAPTTILINNMDTSTVHVPENINIERIATLEVVDSDTGQKFVYEITEDTSELLAVTGNIIQSLTALDFESNISSITFTVKVTDSGLPALSYNRTFELLVDDVNEAPTKVVLSNSEVNENSVFGTVIGTFNIDDPEVNQQFDITILDNYNGLFVVEDGILKVGDDGCKIDSQTECGLDFENLQNMTLSFVVKDDGLPPKSAKFDVAINVKDVNEPPREITLQGNKAVVGSPSGTVIGSLIAIDEDADQEFIFELKDNLDAFNIDTSNNLLVNNGALLQEGELVYVTVKTSDNGNPPLSSEGVVVVISVGSENVTITLSSEGTPLSFPVNNVSVKENSLVDEKIATIVTEILDEERVFTINIHEGSDYLKAGNTDCSFDGSRTICRADLQINKTMDYESTKAVDLIIEATSDNGKKYIEQFQIKIADENENPSDITFSESSINIQENSKEEFVGIFQAIDPDMDDTHKFSLLGTTDLVLSESGTLSSAPDASVDFETADVIEILVTTIDSGGLSINKSFVVNVIDQNEKPTRLNIAANKVAEMSDVGTPVGDLLVEDPDSSQAFNFEIIAGDNGVFEISDSTLKVADRGEDCDTLGDLHCLLDYESKSMHTLTVKVTDNGNPPLSELFTLEILVTDINDKPSSVQISTTKVEENIDVDTVIAEFNAKDQDRGQDFTFELGSSHMFYVLNNSLVLNGTLDFEAESMHTLQITAKDNGNPALSITATAHLEVIDINEPPNKLTIVHTIDSDASFIEDSPRIRENLEPATFVGQIAIFDPDSSEEVSLQILSSALMLQNKECIPLSKGTRCTWDLRSTRSFDFEKEEHVSFDVIATDGGGLQLQREFALEIMDTNDAPTDILLTIDNEVTNEITILENTMGVVVAELTTEDEEAEQTYIYDVVDNTKSLFVSNNELRVTSAAILDFERMQQFTITVKVTDSGNPPLTLEKQFPVHVGDVNEPPVNVFLSNSEIAEDADAGDAVGVIAVQDPDNVKGEKQTFTVTVTDIGSPFGVEGNRLMVKGTGFDKSSYNVDVNVTDSGSPALSAIFQLKVDILDVNDPPVRLDFTGEEILENLEIGRVVGELRGRDDDIGQTLVYSIVNSDLFSIKNDNVIINGLIDYEASEEITFTAKVTDDGDPPLSLETNFTLKVEDVNELPVSLTMKNNTDMKISEGKLVEDTVGTIQVTDEDRTEIYAGEIITGKEFFKFAPTGFVCKEAKFKKQMTVCNVDLLLASLLDYETMTEISVTLSVRDKGGLEIKQLFTFGITNENEPPKNILLDTELTSIPENDKNFVVGGLSTIDDDKTDIHSYQVITYWNIFTIIGNKLYVRDPLDYETRQSYTVSIKSTDSGTPKMSLIKEFVLNVSNVNEAPSEIILSHNEVEAGAEAGSVISHVTVIDPDNVGEPDVVQIHACTLSPTELFTIDQDNSVVVKTTIPLDIPLFNVSINCTDSGIPRKSKSQEFQISVVKNVNAPKGIKLLTDTGEEEITVEENLASASLGNFIVFNLLTKQPESGTYTYAVENSADIGITTEGSSLQLSKARDYEETPSVKINVTAVGTDSGGRQLTLEQDFKIYVTDVNEAPTDIGVYGGRGIQENSLQGSIIGDLYTVDPEVDQTYTYTILGINYGFEVTVNHTDLSDVFVLDGRTLKVGSNFTALNYETSDIITILMQSTDSGDPPYSIQTNLHVQIIDVNDPPTDIQLSSSVIGEDSPVDTVVGTLIVDDEDVNEDHRCEILNVIDVPFKVVNSKEVVVDGDMDFESTKSYNLKITCWDIVSEGTGMKLMKTLLVNVSNVNEPPTDVQLTTNEIQEGNAIGQVVGEIKVVDLDSLRTFISLEEDGDWELFSLEGDSTLVANVSFDFEAQTYYTLTVNATDDEGSSTLKRFEIQITDINEAPSAIQLESQEILENKLPGDIVGKLTTLDPDRDQKFVYTLDKHTTDAGTFVLEDSLLRVGPEGLDFERQYQHLLSITSTDDGSPPLSVQANFTINVIDTNEPPTDILITLIEDIPEDTAIRTVISTVQVDDPDVEQRHSCQLNDTKHLALVTNNADELNLVVLQSLDFEETPAMYISISCTDGEFEVAKIISVNVSDVNEPPISIKLSGSQTVKATAEPGHVIGQLTVDDEDFGQTHTFTVVGPNSDLIGVSESNGLLLKSTIPSAQIEQLDPSLRFILNVADNGEPVLTYNQTFNIPITNIDIITYEIPKVSIDNKNITENSNAGTVIGQLFYVGDVSNDNLYMSIEENFGNLFEIRNDTYLVLSKGFSNTDAASLEITIKAMDTQSQDFSLSKIMLFVQRTCATDETMCNNNETCVAHNNTYSECQCQSDFERDSNNVCSVIDNCVTDADSVCENGGTCVDDVNSFVCKCSTGFGGDLCEIDNRGGNPCTNHSCQNGAICTPDLEHGTYNCTCTVGWEGSRCQLSQDDCTNGVCYNGGTCNDKHLTYLCDCGDDYKGLRCQYPISVCRDKSCNATHTCVGLALRTDSLCVDEQSYLVELTYEKHEEVENINVFLARLDYFIVNNGRLHSVTSPSIRRKRETLVDKAQVYVVDAVEVDTDNYRFSLVILNEDGEPFTKDAALSVLSLTCTKINLGDSSETMFCPEIQRAARNPHVPRKSSSSAGLIAGIICTVIILIAVVVAIFFIYKKKKGNAVSPEVIESAPGSRRSSGYSSITKAGRPLPSPTVSKNQVVPQVDDQSATSASELQHVN